MESMGTSVSVESRIRDTSIDYFPSFMAYHICGQIVHDIGGFFSQQWQVHYRSSNQIGASIM
jgi:hypothetical protein